MSQLEIWDRAQLEFAQRHKFDCEKNLGG